MNGEHVSRMQKDPEHKEPTREDLLVRVERQRRRAERWTEKHDKILDQNRELERLACDYAETIEALREQHKLELEELKKKHDEKLGKINQWHEKALEALRQKEDESQNLRWALDQKEEAIKIGEREIERRKKERSKAKYRKLMDSPIYDEYGGLVPWLRKAVKRELKASSNVPVYVVKGNEVKLTGEPGYYTTLSGNTVVHSPGAYKWRTSYHGSTERIDVGRAWIARNKGRLAKKESLR